MNYILKNHPRERLSVRYTNKLYERFHWEDMRQFKMLKKSFFKANIVHSLNFDQNLVIN